MSSSGGTPGDLGHVSASASENHANSTPAQPSASVSAAQQKPRSCAICRRRKVRCDKLSPCSNCRRANIPCVFPSTDRPPRWARRLERLTNANANAGIINNNNSNSHDEHTATASSAGDGARLPPQDNPGATTQVMERLRTLEGLVRDLSGQLEQANASAGGSGAASVAESPGSAAGTSDSAAGRLRDATATSIRGTAGAQKDVGRLFVRDANASRSRYVSSGFWSRINDELDGLKADLGGDNDDASEDDDSPGNTASTSYQLDRTPSERHAFLFRHDLGAGVPFHEFHPLPSQIPYILNVFAENVNYFLQVVHMPTLSKQIKVLRGGDLSTLPICTQALLFSIYYAAVTSMEDDDVMVNFGTSKAELSLKYRLGLEHALSQADFLNNPDLALVQAFGIFLGLVRRHDSPRYVWMMTGLAIRMAQALGLHRDGAHFPHLTPFEVEMRRRVWCAICALDLRASEDQGTDVTIARSSYDTRLPLNINDADINVDTKETPPERPGIADATVAILMYKIGDLSRRMVSPGTTLQEQDALLHEMSVLFDRGYLQYTTEPGNMAAWVGTTCLRLVVAKMTLLVYLPSLFGTNAASSSSPSSSLPGSDNNRRVSDGTRNKLLVAAIEVAEYNHALNSEEGCRQWRWIYQTYTHWYAIVYLLIEIIRRPLSPIVERAWLALHSRWLIPTNHKLNSSSQVWVPLRRMMAKARQHREAELERLRGDGEAVRELEEADRDVPVPGSSGPFTATTSGGQSGEDLCLEYWRSLVTTPRPMASNDLTTQSTSSPRPNNPPPEFLPVPATSAPSSSSLQHQHQQQSQNVNAASPYPDPNAWPSSNFDSAMVPPGPSPPINNAAPDVSTTAQSMPMEPFLLGSWVHGQASDGHPGDRNMGWLWADPEPTAGYNNYAAPDVRMDIDADIDWVSWMESAKNLESSTSQNM